MIPLLCALKLTKQLHAPLALGDESARGLPL